MGRDGDLFEENLLESVYIYVYGICSAHFYIIAILNLILVELKMN